MWQAWETTLHLLKSFESFSLRTASEKGGAGVAQGMLGVTPAPSYVVHTAEQQRRIEAERRYVPTPLEKRRRFGLR